MSEENQSQPQGAPQIRVPQAPRVQADRPEGDIVAQRPTRERASAVVGKVDRPIEGGNEPRRGDRRGPGGDRRGPGGDRRGPGGDRRGRGDRAPIAQQDEVTLFEKVVHINRCAKVVSKGRRFSFAALVVVGDQNGSIGVGYGKAKEVPDCIRKGTERAKKNMRPVALKNNTIPHEALGEHDGGKVLVRPAVPGTGIIAGGGVRAVLEAAGIKDVLTKSLGSNNPAAMVHATLDALRQLRTQETIRELLKAE